MINISDIRISAPMLSQIAEIDRFKGAWAGNAGLRAEQLKMLRKVSTIESVGSSNRIEGNKLTDEQVDKLLNSIGKKTFKSRDEEEVAGYAELMNLIFDNYSVIPISENYIKQLHKILLQYVSKDDRHRGDYKKLSNSVAVFDETGVELGIVFETAAPFDTPRMMEELLEWTRKNLSDPFLHPLIVIGAFVVHFLAIHPFQDGNGRLSRALTTLLLLKYGYTYVPYSSMESIIEASKDGYYRAIRSTQKNIWSGDVDYEPWLDFFIASLLKQKRHLEEKVSKLTSAGSDTRLGKTAKTIMELFDADSELTQAEITNALGLNPATTKKTLARLVADGYLIKHGSTKGAYYSLANA